MNSVAPPDAIISLPAKLPLPEDARWHVSTGYLSITLAVGLHLKSDNHWFVSVLLGMREVPLKHPTRMVSSSDIFMPPGL
jgi:hypothetical protein